MGTPWGWITARQEAQWYEIKLKDLQRRVDKAIELLQKDNPDIKLVIRILKPPKDSTARQGSARKDYCRHQD